MKFAYESFPVSQLQVEKVKEVRELFSSLSEALETIIPKGRYSSIVETQLETAAMFAVKAITHSAPQNPIEEPQKV